MNDEYTVVIHRSFAIRYGGGILFYSNPLALRFSFLKSWINMLKTQLLSFS